MRYVLWLLPLTALFFGLAACDDNGGSGGESSRGSVTFALTDAPSDELSVFQIELTKLTIFATDGRPTQVFPQQAGATRVVNLLRLRGVHQLLANAPLKPGSYNKVELEFINAIAVDNNANRLTINPSDSGTATILLQPALVVGNGNLFFEIDFDVNNSVSNLVTGPGGSLTLNPFIIARVDDSPSSGQKIEDFKGVVQSVGSMEMNVSLGAGRVKVSLTTATIIEANGAFITADSPGFNLASIISVGNIVEVDGFFNAAANSVTATKIELEDGMSGSGFDGPEAQGLIVALGTGSFDLLVTESRDSGFTPGSIQAISYSAGTFFKWSDPDALASNANLRLGMEVRTTGADGAPADAQRVKLRATELRGTITAVSAGSLQAEMEVARIEGVSVSSIPGFSNPVTLQFFGTMPVSVTTGSFVEVEGHLDRTTNGVFDVTGGHGEDNHTHALEGSSFSVISSNPLILSINGKLEGAGGVVFLTGTVTLAGNVVIIEENDDAKTKVQINATALEAGINASRYVKLKAEGPWDAGSSTMTATKIVAEMN